MNHFKYSIRRQKLSNNGGTQHEMKGTNHVSNLMWQFWCMMSSCFTNVHTLGLRTENSNNNSVLKEGELKEEASPVHMRAFLLSE